MRSIVFTLLIYITLLWQTIVCDQSIESARQRIDELLNNQKLLPYTYHQIWRALNDLQLLYPSLLKLDNVTKLYGKNAGIDVDRPICNGEPCYAPQVELAYRPSLRIDTPAIFYSGCIHGDEIAGPSIALQFILQLVTQFDKNDKVFYLLTHRKLMVYPFLNAYGFYALEREEGGIDPNRDFPYLNASCFRSRTSRLVSEIFLHNLYTSGITWHGGMRAISYPWGSFDHALKQSNGYSSRPSPDDATFKRLGTLLQEAAGHWTQYYFSSFISPLFYSSLSEDEKLWYYPLGSMNELVYPVHGGLEDWAFSASFSSSPDPISICTSEVIDPKNSSIPLLSTPYGNKILHGEHDLRCAIFLVETEDNKAPSPSEFGQLPLDISNPIDDSDSFLIRNLRMAFKLAEHSQPDMLLIAAPSYYQLPGCIVNLAFWAVGCETVQDIRVELRKGKCHELTQPRRESTDSDIDAFELTTQGETSEKIVDMKNGKKECMSISPWESIKKSTIGYYRRSHDEVYKYLTGEDANDVVLMRIKVPPEVEDGEYCIFAFSTFEKNTEGDNPSVKSETLLSQSVLHNQFYAKSSQGENVVFGNREWLFPRSNIAFPGHLSPFGYPVHMHGNFIDGFALMFLKIPYIQNGNPDAKDVFLTITFGGSIHGRPFFFDKYSGMIRNTKGGDALPYPSICENISDVFVKFHPPLDEILPGKISVELIFMNSAQPDTIQVLKVAHIPTGPDFEDVYQNHDTFARDSILMLSNTEARFRLNIPATSLFGQFVRAVWFPNAHESYTIPIGDTFAIQNVAPRIEYQTLFARSGETFSVLNSILNGQPEKESTNDHTQGDPVAFTNIISARQHAPDIGYFLNTVFGQLFYEKYPQYKNTQFTDYLRRFFPYVNVLQCVLSPFAANLGDASKSTYRPIREAPKQTAFPKYPLTGKFSIYTVWTKHHTALVYIKGGLCPDVITSQLEIKFHENCCSDITLDVYNDSWILKEAFDVQQCHCGPGANIEIHRTNKNIQDQNEISGYCTLSNEIYRANELRDILIEQNALKNKDITAILDENMPEPDIAEICNNHGYFHPMIPPEYYESKTSYILFHPTIIKSYPSYLSEGWIIITLEVIIIIFLLMLSGYILRKVINFYRTSTPTLEMSITPTYTPFTIEG